MITVYEREKIDQFIGSKESQIEFLQTFPKSANFQKNYSIFYTSGIYQLIDGPPILVLPWFFKDHESLLDEDKERHSLQSFFEIINQIKKYKNSSVDLKNGTNVSAIDIMMHSFLLNMLEQVKYLTSFNFHQDVSRVEKSIKGRWDIVQDLKNGPRPLNFTCEYNSLEYDISILLFLKAFLKYSLKILSSRKNKILVENILGYLKDVTDIKVTRVLVNKAKAWTYHNPKFESLLSVVEFAESILFGKDVYSKKAGMSYHFRMDKFFEALTLKLFKLKNEIEINTQTRENLLGGAVWKKEGDYQVDSQIKKAIQFTIPDLILEDDSHYVVLECKYKPFRIPLINGDSKDADLISYNRNDRNQILSFLMSVRPSISFAKRKIQFAVIFPCREVEIFEVAELAFSSAKLHIDPFVRNLIQNRHDFSDSTMLTVKFIGLNVSAAIKSVLDNDASIADNIFNELKNTTRVENEEKVPPTKFENVIEKRLALTSMVINESKGNETLGRVKLAKVFYLADKHLCLDMKANYVREAAGPLDHRMIYNEKIGIENRGELLSYFHAVDQRRRSMDRVKYIPSTNFSYITNKAKEIFIDKYENILSVIKMFLPLNTEQSEIVATLYACWNDLLILNRSDVSDEKIIFDFHNNWHVSKKRFDEDRLRNALGWMRENELVPSGMGTVTVSKQENIPSGF